MPDYDEARNLRPQGSAGAGVSLGALGRDPRFDRTGPMPPTGTAPKPDTPFSSLAEGLSQQLAELEQTMEYLGQRLLPVRNPTPAGTAENGNKQSTGVETLDALLSFTGRILAVRQRAQQIMTELVV